MNKRHRKAYYRAKRRLINLTATLIAGLILSYIVWFLQTREVVLPKTGEPALLLSTETHNHVRGAISQALDEAQKSILVLIYALSDKHIIHTLNRKANEGIDVKIICDANASTYIEQKLSPKIHLIKRYGKGLMHLKLIVIDGKQTWIGSANLTGDSLTRNGNLVMAMDSPEVAAFVTEKANSMDEVSNSQPFPHRNFNIGGQLLEFWFLPDNPDASIRIKDLMRSAKKSIRIAMFAWTRYDFANVVVDARLRGVNVEVAMDNNQRNSTESKVPEILLRAGISACVNKGRNLLHHKFLYIDNSTLVNGSANWTRKAFSENDDCFIVLHNLNEQQQRQMDELWKVIQRTACDID